MNIEIKKDSRLIVIPKEMLSDYQTDSLLTHRDFGGVVTRKVSKFIKDESVILNMFDKSMEKPWDNMNLFKNNFIGKRNIYYHCHIDLGKNHDHCGICLGHNSDIGIVLDFAESLDPKDYGGEIDFEEVRNIIETFNYRNFDVYVTYDSWQSADSIQMLNKMGIHASLFSLDKDMRGYLSLRRSLYERNVKTYYNEIAEKELKGLIMTDRKIDHPPHGSKDLADAIASVVYHVDIGTKTI